MSLSPATRIYWLPLDAISSPKSAARSFQPPDLWSDVSTQEGRRLYIREAPEATKSISVGRFRRVAVAGAIVAEFRGPNPRLAEYV